MKNERGDTVYKAGDRSDDYVSYGFSTKSEVRPEVRDAYKSVIDTMFQKAEKYVEDTQKADQFVARTKDDVAKSLAAIRKDLAEQKDPQYWKRNNKPASAEQLAEFDTIAEKIIAGEMLETSWRAPENKSRHRMMSGHWTNDALDKISAVYKAVRGRSGFGSGQVRGVLDSLRGDMNRYSQRLKMLAEAQRGETKTKKVPTSYAMEAKSIDQGRASKSWTTPHEMAARAFQSYVEDKLAEQGGRSDFLTYGTQRLAVPTPWGWAKPFPEGEERKAINAAFDTFVDVIDTKDTDKGVAIFSTSGSTVPESDWLSVSEIADIARQATAKFAHEPDIFILDRADEVLPASAVNDDTDGFTYKGGIYLVRSGLRDAVDVERTLFHELFHYGIRRFLTKEQYIAQMGVAPARESGQRLRKWLMVRKWLMARTAQCRCRTTSFLF